MREGIREAWESVLPRHEITLDQFDAAMQQCEVFPMHARGQCCGAVLVWGREIHACILPWARGRWFGRRAAAILNMVIDRHGEATTHATTEEGRRFVERLGFMADGEIYRRTEKWASNRYSQ